MTPRVSAISGPSAGPAARRHRPEPRRRPLHFWCWLNPRHCGVTARAVRSPSRYPPCDKTSHQLRTHGVSFGSDESTFRSAISEEYRTRYGSALAFCTGVWCDCNPINRFCTCLSGAGRRATPHRLPELLVHQTCNQRQLVQPWYRRSNPHRSALPLTYGASQFHFSGLSPRCQTMVSRSRASTSQGNDS